MIWKTALSHCLQGGRTLGLPIVAFTLRITDVSVCTIRCELGNLWAPGVFDPSCCFMSMIADASSHLGDLRPMFVALRMQI